MTMTTRTRLAAGALALAAFVVPMMPGTASAKTSSACKAALDDAEKVFASASRTSGHLGDYFTALAASSQRNASNGLAGVTAFVQDQTAAVQILRAYIDTETETVNGIAPTYRAHAAACRKG